MLSGFSVALSLLIADELSGGIVTLLPALILGSPSSEEDYVIRILSKS